MRTMTGKVRIAYLHHSTGGILWAGGVPPRVHRLWNDALPECIKARLPRLSRGVPGFIRAWNAAHDTQYEMKALTYPATTAGYPWANYPHDYWNLWVAHKGAHRDRGEMNLDDLVECYDVIVFKHCFPVSQIGPDGNSPSVSDDAKTLANYRLQYAALKKRLYEFPDKRFIVWTAPALTPQSTTLEQAERAGRFVDWVKNTWDERGDNLFVWDFHALQTDGGPYLVPEHARGPKDPHPARSFASKAAAYLGRRIVDVIEGRGDTESITGSWGP